MKKTISYSTLSVFFNDISILVTSAAMMEDILLLLKRDEKDADFAEILGKLAEAAAEGSSLSEAMKKTGGFPDYALHMISAAEAAGRLEEVCRSLGAFYHRRAEMQAVIRDALVQPLILLILLGTVMGVFVRVVLPMLVNVYGAMGGEASVYVGLAYGIGGAAFGLILLILLCLLLALLAARFGVLRGPMKRFWEKNPLTRDLALGFARAFYTDDLTTRVTGGVLMDEALEQAARAVDHSALREKAERCADRVAHGENLGQVFYEESPLPPVQTHRLFSGARSGGLDEALVTVCGELYTEAENGTEALVRRIEPALTGFFTVTVALSLLSVMLPILATLTVIG